MSVTTKRDMAQYKRYGAYISSRIEWLDEAPSHWMISRSDAVLDTERTQVALDFFADKEVFHYSIPAVQQYGTGLVENGEDVGSSKQRITEPVLLVSRLNPRKATICWARPQKEFTIASTEFVALKPRKCEGRFLEYLVNSENYRQRLDSWVQSATKSHQRVRPELIYKFWGAWPPIGEQRAIADFLDCKTALIDEVIAKKQKLIELLKEKRQALITQAVTKGLDPNAKLRPSGIEWLGDIPEGWEVKRLKYVSRTRVSNVNKKSEDENVVRLCNYVDVYKNEFITDTIDFMSATATLGQIEEFGLQFGDVLITKDSETPDDIGVPALVTMKDTSSIVCGYHLAIITPSTQSLLGGYLFRLLQSKRYGSYFEVNCNGVTRFGLSMYPILNIDVLIPPLREQEAIVDFLSQQSTKVDGVIDKAMSQIQKLKEYRQALITSAVTGKIDVSQKESRVE